jgi:hypothetical protein
MVTLGNSQVRVFKLGLLIAVTVQNGQFHP